MKKTISVLLTVLALAGMLTGCVQPADTASETASAPQTVPELPGASQGVAAPEKKLQIVTTIFPEYDWVREIMGEQADNAQITMLLDNGVDLHSYQPTADDMIKIADCDLFVYVGGESDGWVEDALKNAANKGMQVIDLLDVLKDTVKTEEAKPGMQASEEHNHGYSHFDDSDVQNRTLSDWDGDWQSVYPYLQEGILDEVMERKAEHFHIYSGNDGFDALSQEMDNWPTYYPADMSGNEIKEDMLEHEEKEYDEHVWLSLKNAQTLVGAISDALQKLDPENKDTYAANSQAYVKKLSALDGDYQAAVDDAAYKTVLFGDRFPFRYLVDDYGLNYYAAFAGCSAESEASFETVSFLAQKVDQLKLPCVLTIEGKQHQIAETIVQNTAEKNQKILTMDSMQSTTSRDVAAGVTYLSVMEKNLTVLKEALG